ncbi:MAG: S8 family peptidase, partial [Armatimonadetes bacterium]|nr:S8 family peptidase [Armatimonadota bacterium]
MIKLNYSKEDLTQGGKIPLIVFTKKEDELKNARNVFLQKGSGIAKELPIINGFVAEVEPKELTNLTKGLSRKAHISLDRYIKLSDPIKEEKTISSKLDVAIPALGVDEIWEKGYTGKGVTEAIIDTGLYPHPDYKERILAFKDFINGKNLPYDDQGHATHVAGISAGNGKASLGKFRGVAPDANLVGIKVLDRNGGGNISTIIQGVQWAIQNKNLYNIKIINLSLGGPALLPWYLDPLARSIQKAEEFGILPMVAAGNEGPNSKTIGTPGNAPKAFTIGALDDNGTVVDTDDTVASFSSRGPVSYTGGVKPDILAPGVSISSANAPGSQLDQDSQIPHIGQYYITLSGTSMATPYMSGLAALYMQAKPQFGPKQIKEL